MTEKQDEPRPAAVEETCENCGYVEERHFEAEPEDVKELSSPCEKFKAKKGLDKKSKGCKKWFVYMEGFPRVKCGIGIHLCLKCKPQETCENCGHDWKQHGERYTLGDDGCFDCSCEKFKAKNHNPQGSSEEKTRQIPEDTPSDASAKNLHFGGARNLSVADTEGTFNLSEMLVDCMCDMEECGRKVLYEDAVKEFIRRLKEHFYAQDFSDDDTFEEYMEFIDKLAGKNLSGDL